MDGHERDTGAIVLAISGMTSSSCANTVRHVLSRVPGVFKTEVDLASARAVVTERARTEELVPAIEGAGYGARLAAGDVAEGRHHVRGRSGCC
jgi:copper chaperone CopZ